MLSSFMIRSIRCFLSMTVASFVCRGRYTVQVYCLLLYNNMQASKIVEYWKESKKCMIT